MPATPTGEKKPRGRPKKNVRLLHSLLLPLPLLRWRSFTPAQGEGVGAECVAYVGGRSCDACGCCGRDGDSKEGGMKQFLYLIISWQFDIPPPPPPRGCLSSDLHVILPILF